MTAAPEKSDKRSPPNEEPELSSDESVPSDGKDPVGEKMMEDLAKSKGDGKADDRRK